MHLNAGKDAVAFLAPEIGGKRPRKSPQTLALRAGVAARGAGFRFSDSSSHMCFTKMKEGRGGEFEKL